MVYKPSSYSLLVYQVYLFDLQAAATRIVHIVHTVSDTIRLVRSEHYTDTIRIEHYTDTIRLVRIEHYTSCTYLVMVSTGSWSNGLVHPVLGEAVPPTSQLPWLG